MRLANKLYVVGAYYNHRRSAHRPGLVRKWAKDNLDSGASVMLVQHAFGERPYEFSTDDPDFRHVTLVNIRGGAAYELWIKEALLNYGFSRLPEEAQYINWQDTDVSHVRHDWADETVHMLQHNIVGQTWTHSVDLDADANIMTDEWGVDVNRSFAKAFIDGDVGPTTGSYASPKALIPPDKKADLRSHTGWSWAIRRGGLFGGIGALPDWDIIGSADWHIARAFAGIENGMVNFKASPGYTRRWLEFARICDLHIKQDIGVVPGTLLAGFHGSKTKRYYVTRNEVLGESGFDPDKDIGRDAFGLPYLCSDNRKLRDGLRRYNMLREAA
jgi:hypothetical protein